MPTKLVPLSSTPEETTALLAHGEREAEHQIQRMLHNTEEELDLRLKSPLEIRFYNKDRQKRHEDRLKGSMMRLMGEERDKLAEKQEMH